MMTISGRPIEVTKPHWRFDPLGRAQGFGVVGDDWWTTRDGHHWYRCSGGSAERFTEGNGFWFRRRPFRSPSERPPHLRIDFPLE